MKFDFSAFTVLIWGERTKGNWENVVNVTERIIPLFICGP